MLSSASLFHICGSTMKVFRYVLSSTSTLDKLQLTGRNLGRVFIFRSVHLHSAHLWFYRIKLPNLKLKTQPKQLIGSLPIDITLPASTQHNGTTTFFHKTLGIKTLINIILNEKDTQHNYNDFLHYDTSDQIMTLSITTQHNDIQHLNNQYNNTMHNSNLLIDNQYKDIQHNNNQNEVTRNNDILDKRNSV
jgi:hypothetical protein